MNRGSKSRLPVQRRDGHNPQLLRPTQHLRELSAKYPGLWDIVSLFRAHRGKSLFGKGRTLPDWPVWCYLPFDGLQMAMQYAQEFASETQPAQRPMGTMDALRASGIVAWRATQGVYRVDPEILEAVWETPISGALPVELLYRLPEWSVYLETPGKSFLTQELYGFWAHLDYHSKFGTELKLLLDTSGGLQPLGLGIKDNTTIEQALASTILMQHGQHGSTAPQTPEAEHYLRMLAARQALFSHCQPEVEPLLSLLLYLCSETAEYRDSKGSQIQPGNPKPILTLKDAKKGRPAKLIPPAQPRLWEVSYRLGAALRAARERVDEEPADGTHARPRPHVRRAHWHTFLAGPRDEPRERRLRWMPPIPVGVRDLEELVPVVRPVK